MFQSIEKYCKTKYGYGSPKNVDRPGYVEDRMESFFLAETLKYLYLLFDPDSEIDILNKVRCLVFFWVLKPHCLLLLSPTLRRAKISYHFPACIQYRGSPTKDIRKLVGRHASPSVVF